MRAPLGVLLTTGLAIAACGGAAATVASSTSAPSSLPGQPQSLAPAAPTASGPASADAVLALGKNVFETAGGIGCRTCHGADAKGKALDGGANAPNIRGATEQKLRDALAGGAAPMAFLKLKDEEIEAVIKYLGSLD